MIDTLCKVLAAGHEVNVAGLRGSSAAMMVAWTADCLQRPVLCVVPNERLAELFAQDLKLFTQLPIIAYPGYDIPPYTLLSPDQETVAARLATLYQLASDNHPCVTVASCEALLRRVIPKGTLTGLAELVINNEEVNQEGLCQRLIDLGYEHVSLVQNVGDFSRRGGIVDVFPPGYSAPVRLDFFGDTVESLRTFDPISQRSIAELEEAVFLPASNILFPAPASDRDRELLQRFHSQGRASGWDSGKQGQMLAQIDSRRRFPGIEHYLPLFYESLSLVTDFIAPNTVIFSIDPSEINRSMRLCWERIRANHNEARATATPALPPEHLFLTPEEVDLALAAFHQVRAFDFPEATTTDAQTITVQVGNHKLLKQEIDLHRKKQGLLLPLVEKISGWLDERERVLFACRSSRHARHLAELLDQHNLSAAMIESPVRGSAVSQLVADRVYLLDQPLSQGFDLGALRLHILAEGELFGVRSLPSRKKYSRPRDETEEPIRFDQLSPGDVVVHREHGIGIYDGLINMVVRSLANDFLQISYQGQDKLYVPIDRINAVSKYKGLSDKPPPLDRLGGKSWLTAKKKVEEAVWAVAQDLLELYAKRELRQGKAFSRPDELYGELEESFPYEETPGQNKAISDVISDLVSDKPMDRLLCGDVGYGKTEVAIRAAFKVIEDGFQVAVLVPTTVLAEQHGQTFAERLTDFPVQVASLSRFRTPADQRRILKELAAGQVDIVIGTHRLLSRDVTFKRLGLLIIDEEHRFGVTHKEKIKRLRAEVDVLTLSATPIPRTLQMSLLGVRDLSVIATPPEHRRSVKTFVARYDDLVIKEAVIRELQRQGQTFIVHNRVQSIHEMAHKVQKLVPEAKVAVAHGQMPAKKLEEIMVRFINRELDVLICTTIIESGLDITNANTIIINRADRLGLAEIYQLRGRVGRGSEQSYAYLLVPSLDGLTKDSRDRLRALMDCSELGGGFKLAMSDLQIRGGGNILGVSQSGHIEAVGYDLYLELLQKTVADLKSRAANHDVSAVEVEPELNLQVSAYIPEDYIVDTDQRYVAYRRISGVMSHESLQDLREELRDRYGELPEETENLFEIIGLKIELARLRIVKLEQGKDSLIFSFHEQTPIEPKQILQFMDEAKGRVRLTPDERLIVLVTLTSAGAVFQNAGQILSRLQA